MAEHTAVGQNVLPGSKKPIDYVLEICKSPMVHRIHVWKLTYTPTVMLFWKLIDLNKVHEVSSGPYRRC